jgi:glycosyltransferase involved in cell wall biosynthesis
VLAQTYPNVELIVLDDGSTDHTPAVLARLPGHVRRERHDNMGQARTLTKGWAMARGDILAYLSADDVLRPDAVAESVAALAVRPDAVACYPSYALIDPQSRIVREVRAPAFDYQSMLVDVVCLPGPGAFFRRAAYEMAGPWNQGFRQMPDYDFWLRLGLLGPFVHIDRSLAGFRVHEASQTYAVASPERAAEPVSIVSGVLANPALPEALRVEGPRALAHAHLISAQLHLRAGRFAAAWACVRGAHGLAPRAVLSYRALRLLSNAALNRWGHRILWGLRSLLGTGAKT